MKIFYFTWYENSEQDLMFGLKNLGFDVIKCHIPITDYEQDEVFTKNLERIFIEYKCEIFFSFNFFPLIAKSAERLQKRYISWVYDMPHISLYSPSMLSRYVSLFSFDKNQYLQLKAIKGENVYHLPLAVNVKRLNEMLHVETQNFSYKYDLSFVGSLYEQNNYCRINYLPEYVQGFVNGVVAAQQKIYGYNLVAEVLNDKVLNDMRKYVIMDVDKSYLIDNKQLYVDMINAEVTHRERIALLKSASEYFDMKLFTASKSSELPQHIFSGTVSYDKQMPKVFRDSKINLNITLRSITSGIPLRALDIMGAGGFLLTNYQPEIAEYFVDGKECVMFESREDMLRKISYYLENEEERKQIAYNGWKKVKCEFSYEKQLKIIFEQVGVSYKGIL